MSLQALLLGFTRNFFICIAFISIINLLRALFSTRKLPKHHNFRLGVLFGLAACIGMLFPIEYAPGVLRDFRNVLVALGCFIGGWTLAIPAAILPIAFRTLLGGPGTFGGIVGIVLSSIVGLLGYAWRVRHPKVPRWLQFLSLGVAIYAATLLMLFAIPKDRAIAMFNLLALPEGITTPLLTLTLGLLYHWESHRQETTSALRISEEKFRLLAENIPGVIYLCNNDERYTMRYISDSVEDITGYTAQTFLKDEISFVELFHPDDKDGIFTLVDEALDQRKSFDLQYRINNKHGELRWIHEVGVGVFREQTLIYLEGYLQDITQRKALEHQLLQSQKLETVGLLAGGVAHDFNNLLTAISGYTELCKLKTQDDDGLQMYLNQTLDAADRGTQLTRQLLAFARKDPPKTQTIDLNPFIEKSLHMMQRLISEKCQLHTHFSSTPCQVKADPNQLEQVLMNLIVNARDAMPTGGSITLQTAQTEIHQQSPIPLPPGSYVTFSVHDTGIGIPPELIPKLFEPFFTTKESHQGTGLGLSTCHGIIKQHNGHIQVESTPAQGTTFTVYLPLSHDPPSPQSTPSSDQAPALPSGDERILIVEDDPSIQTLIDTTLSQLGYHVTCADHDKKALQLLRTSQEPFSLVISDISMARAEGARFAHTIQQEFPQLKALFCSGHAASSASNQSILDAGFLILPKPYTPTQLAQSTRDLLDQP